MIFLLLKNVIKFSRICYPSTVPTGPLGRYNINPFVLVRPLLMTVFCRVQSPEKAAKLNVSLNNRIVFTPGLGVLGKGCRFFHGEVLFLDGQCPSVFRHRLSASTAVWPRHLSANASCRKGPPPCSSPSRGINALFRQYELADLFGSEERMLELLPVPWPPAMH